MRAPRKVITREKLRQQWGLVLMAAISLFALVKLLLQQVPGHYRVFTGAGRALWHGQNPYGDTFGTGVGFYFYSPTCALTVFGPLSTLPEKVGIVVYMFSSFCVFVWGARKLWRSYASSESVLQWFWAAITAQLVSGILNSKLEILIAGLLLGSIAVLKDSAPRLNRRAILAALLFALILNWKFQPLPVAGLFLLARLLIWRDWKTPLLIAAALSAWYSAPFLFFAPAFVAEIHDKWQATFGGFVLEAFLGFENLFAFLHNVLSISVTFAQSQLVSAAIGASFGVYLLAWILRARAHQTPLAQRSSGATLIAVGLGATFMSALSPLGQNNALILYSPLLLSAFVCFEKSDSPRTWKVILAVACVVMTLGYSDLVPHVLSQALRVITIKPLICLGLGAAVARETWRIKSERWT